VRLPSYREPDANVNAEPRAGRRVPTAAVAVAIALVVWTVLWLFGRSGAVAPAPVPTQAPATPAAAVQGGVPPTFSPAPGWQVLTSEVAPASPHADPAALAANVPIAERDRELSSTDGLSETATVLSLPRDGVVIFVTLPFVNDAPSPPHFGNWPDLQLPLRLSTAHVTRFSEPTRTRAWPQYEVQGRVAGTYVTATAYFGAAHPGSATIAEAQQELGRLILPGVVSGSAPRSAWTTDGAGSLTIQTPPGWTFAGNPVPDLTGPRIWFALGTWPFPRGGECAPETALRFLPRDGALLWLSEVSGAQDVRGEFPRQPARFSVDGIRAGRHECSSNRPSYALRFRSRGRFFQVQIAFGPRASPATRAEALRSLSSFRVGAR
jgi:hypothetical protein